MTALITGATSPTAGSPQLRVVDLGALNGECCSQAAAINNRGEVVGFSSISGGGVHAFLWRDGHLVDLGTLGGTFSTANDINDRGEIVGTSELPNGSLHATLWRDGQPIDLGTLGGNYSMAAAINNAGHIVGVSATTPGSWEIHAFSWHDGRMTDLGLLDGGFTNANDINNRGQILGFHAVGDGLTAFPGLWHRGSVTHLASTTAQVAAVNDRGQVTGSSLNGPASAFLWERGQTTDLGRLPNARFMQALGINDHGDVVGYADVGAFLWRRGQLTALPGLAGNSTTAYDINNRGQIVGSSAANPTGHSTHAVLWTR